MDAAAITNTFVHIWVIGLHGQADSWGRSSVVDLADWWLGLIAAFVTPLARGRNLDERP